MKLDDKNLLRIGETGDGATSIRSKSGLLLSTGYNRIVFGGRGMYVEFSESQIELTNIHIPLNQLYRLTDLRIYYVEFRSCDMPSVKIYYQVKTVAYADYKIGMFYISPTDLYVDGKCILRNDLMNEKSGDFFELNIITKVIDGDKMLL